MCKKISLVPSKQNPEKTETRAGLLEETAKKVPTKKLVSGIGDL
jgi:hypothetical protein